MRRNSNNSNNRIEAIANRNGFVGVSPTNVMSDRLNRSYDSPTPMASGFQTEADSSDCISTGLIYGKRQRTVSLAGEDMIQHVNYNNSDRGTARAEESEQSASSNELSPTLPPLSSPALSPSSFFSLPSQNKTSSSAASVVVTPIPTRVRPMISLLDTSNLNGAPLAMNGNTGGASASGARKPQHFPMELPPVLMNASRRNSEAASVTGMANPAKPPPSVASSSSQARNGSIGMKSYRGNGVATTPATASNVRPLSKKKQQQQQQLEKKPRGRNGKKFSWKSYPELEEFLITNREEYLSFSARNYTIEQRDYNNRLTSRLLELADSSGYPTLFENCPFASVRNRIRSYYKSYVQSFKRRQGRQQQQQQRQKQQNRLANHFLKSAPSPSSQE